MSTFAGLRTDAKARVLDLERRPIPGLFAVGNDAASLMAGRYPAGGITLGVAMTFGFIAAHIAAGDAALISGASRRPSLRLFEHYLPGAGLFHTGDWGVASGVQPRQSPVSCGATRPPAAAGWSIGQRLPSGMPIGRPVGPNRPSLHSTRRCALMWRRDLPASSWPRAALWSWSRRSVEGPPAWSAKGSEMGSGLEPGADCPTVAGRLP